MKFFKALINWKFWLSLVLGALFLISTYFFTFKWLNDYTYHNIEVEVPDLSEMKIQEAMAKLDEMNLHYTIDSVKFTEDVEPFTVIDFYPAAGSQVKPGRKIFIKSNPSDYPPVELPNLIDKSKRMAFTQLAMRNLVVGDTIYEEDPARDAVLRVLYNNKVIQAGTSLPRGAKVDLVLGRGFSVDVNVPDLLGLSFQEAKRMLKERFFNLGNVTFLGESNDTILSSVVYQDPPPTDLYDEGLPVSIWLSDKNRGELRSKIDSMDILFRRKVSRDDSLYYNSVQNANKIDLSDLPEEIRNQVKHDERAKQNMELNKTQQAPAKAKIDTTGISIE